VDPAGPALSITEGNDARERPAVLHAEWYTRPVVSALDSLDWSRLPSHLFPPAYRWAVIVGRTRPVGWASTGLPFLGSTKLGQT